MTVQTTTVRTVLSGNGAVTVFPFGFHCADPATVAVMLTDPQGNQTTLAPSAYAVALNSTVDGGSVTLATAPAGGTTVTIVRAVPLIQSTNIANQDGFFPSVVTDALDDLTMQVQQVADGVARVVQGPVSDPDGTMMVLPPVAQRAGTLLGFDSAGQPIAAQPSGAVVSTAMQPVVAAASPALATSLLQYLPAFTGAVARSLTGKCADGVSVLDFGADPGGTLDSYPAFAAALAAAPRVLVPAGTYLLSQPLDLTNRMLEGTGANASILRSTCSDASKPVLYAGGASVVRNLQLGFAAALVVGSEADGQRVGIACYSAASGLALQRGATLANLLVKHVGTGLWDPPTNNAYATFSVVFDTIEINDWSHRGLDFESPVRTGNVYRNIYIDNFDSSGNALWTGSADCGFLLSGEESECTIEQLNVEWCTVNSAAYLYGVRALAATSIHFEQVTLRSQYNPLLWWKQSSGSIGSLTAYYCPIRISGWSVLAVGDSTYGGAVANPASCATLRIGALHCKGLNSGTQVTGSGSGLNTLTDFAFVTRDSSVAGPFWLQIDAWTWNTFLSDQAIYQNFPADPHNMIGLIATAGGPPVGRTIATPYGNALGWVRRPDGMIEEWGQASVPAASSITVTLPKAFPTACVWQQAEPYDQNTAIVYRVNANPVDAAHIQITSTAATAVTVYWRSMGY